MVDHKVAANKSCKNDHDAQNQVPRVYNQAPKHTHIYLTLQDQKTKSFPSNISKH
jgi:hypothetical protein